MTSVNGSQALTLVISGTINGFMHVESVNLSVASYGFVTDENIVKLKDSYKSLINKPVRIYYLKELDLDKRFELSGHINQIQVATVGETWTSIHVLYCFEWKVPVSNSSLITFETWPASKLLYSQLPSTFKFLDIVANGVLHEFGLNKRELFCEGTLLPYDIAISQTVRRERDWKVDSSLVNQRVWKDDKLGNRSFAVTTDVVSSVYLKEYTP